MKNSPRCDEEVGFGHPDVVDLAHVHVAALVHGGAGQAVEVQGLEFQDLQTG